jgi:hypothetical protein
MCFHTDAPGFLPRMGQRTVATGGAKRNPWSQRGIHSPRRGEGAFVCPAAAVPTVSSATDAHGFFPRMGQRTVATGGAKRNPWSQRGTHSPRRGEGAFVCPAAAVPTVSSATDAHGFFAPNGATDCSHGWSEAKPVESTRNPLAPEGRRGVRLPRRGSSNRFLCPTPRVALRSTRGHAPRPLRGQERSPPGAAIRLVRTNRQVFSE